MKTSHLFISASLMLGLLFSCGSPNCGGDLSEADIKALTEHHAKITEPMHKDPNGLDWKKFIEEHYAPDAKVMPQNGPVLTGRDAILGMYKSLPPMTKFLTKDLKVSGSGNLAYIEGTYEMGLKISDSLTVEDKGKYIEIWKKDEAGKWFCIYDIFNTDLPME